MLFTSPTGRNFSTVSEWQHQGACPYASRQCQLRDRCVISLWCHYRTNSGYFRYNLLTHNFPWWTVLRASHGPSDISPEVTLKGCDHTFFSTYNSLLSPALLGTPEAPNLQSLLPVCQSLVSWGRVSSLIDFSKVITLGYFKMKGYFKM